MDQFYISKEWRKVKTKMEKVDKIKKINQKINNGEMLSDDDIKIVKEYIDTVIEPVFEKISSQLSIIIPIIMPYFEFYWELLCHSYTPNEIKKITNEALYQEDSFKYISENLSVAIKSNNSK